VPGHGDIRDGRSDDSLGKAMQTPNPNVNSSVEAKKAQK
jgi:hypothetical protein